MKARLVIAVCVVVLGGLGARWFFMNFDYVDYREWIGLRGEARRNPYLAAQRMMVRLGTPASELRTITGMAELPINGVLIIGDERDVLTPNGRTALLDWVARGGYLITEDTSTDNSDPLLDALGVRREAVDEEVRSEGKWPLVEFELPHAEQILLAQMHEWQSIERDESLLYARSENANHVLHFRHGEGYVTVLNSMWFMTNVAIGKHDHAEVIYGLISLAPARGSIAFFNQPEDLSIWDWLMEHAWAVVAAGAIALILWLWRIGPRFGPIAPDPQRERRSLLEHLRACGRFEWAAKGGPHLVEAARDVAWRRVARAHPELASMTSDEARRHVAHLFDLHEEDARLLFARPALSNIEQNDFVRSIQVYQRVQDKLQPQRKTGEQA